MTDTLKILEAQDAVSPVAADLALVAASLDALAAYEQAASSCAAAMSASGGMPDAVEAALTSVDVAVATRRVLTRSAGKADLVRLQLGAAGASCELSRSQCASHVHHHEHCRLHVAAADEVISTSTALSGSLSS